MVKVSLLVCVLAIIACAEIVNSKTTEPAPAVDCSRIVASMAKCLTFVANGTKVTKPEASCCDELKAALKSDVQCICEAFKNSRSLGVVLDIQKAMSLPACCGVSASSIDKCGLDLYPGGVALSTGDAPAQPPSRSVALPPTSLTANCFAAPAQDTTKVTSAASTSKISALALLVSLVAASCSFF